MEEQYLTEAEAIDIIREMLGAPGSAVEVGVGDDAAVYHFASSGVILTVDSIYEGIHFTLDNYSLADVGWKAMAASISDIAAMGGQPECALISVAMDAPPTESQIRELMGGALEMARSCDCQIVGGDLCRSASGLGLSVTVAGTRHPCGPVLRSNARDGDIIGVTGTLGDSAAGLYVLQSGSEEMREKFAGLIQKHLRPGPAVEAGDALASSGVSAMDDVSDGLAPDVVHICQASDVGCEITGEDVPLSGELRVLAEEACADPLGWALGGGEDYQLLFTAPPGGFEAALRALNAHGIPAVRIGVIKPAEQGMKLVARDGQSIDLEGLGYDHFL